MQGGGSTVIIEPSEPERAKAAIIEFLVSLHEGRYADAVPYYGGDYETLRTWNPDTKPDDFVKLWKRGCEGNGLVFKRG